jgi:hypothetical protein
MVVPSQYFVYRVDRDGFRLVLDLLRTVCEPGVWDADGVWRKCGGSTALLNACTRT